MQREFWNGKRVLVTGHTGFKGSWLSLWLQHLGAEVTGYAVAPPSRPNLFTIADVGRGMTTVDGDVRDLDRLRRALQDHRPELVVHMAAQALVTQGYADPVRTYTTNVVGTANLLEAVRSTPGVRVVVMVTSDKCYRNNEWVWGYRENDRLGGHDPYGTSKAAAEWVVEAYRSSFLPVEDHGRHGVAVASARAGNVIGGGDWAEARLVPDVVRALLAGEPARLRNPDAIRPWQFVLEPLRGYLLLAERLWDDPAFAEAWNFGPGLAEARSVGWIADYLTEAWGDGASWERAAGDQLREDVFLRLDCSKARSRLGWAPRLSLAQALDRIVEWYRAYARDEDMRALTERQIARYEELPDT
jgi:CDP-glucose 4,6-dehydratase